MSNPQLPTNIPAYLAEVRERVEAATDGPWETESGISDECFGVVTEMFPISPGITQAVGTKQNAEFIARARQDVPTLLALLDSSSDMCLSLAERLEEAEAITTKLPKCWRLTADGRLVQDWPVVPGMELTSLYGRTIQEPRVVREVMWDGWMFEGGAYYNQDNLVRPCCNSREAAEAKGDKTDDN